MRLFGERPKATITVGVTVNGHAMEIKPDKFTVMDGDHVTIEIPMGLAPVLEVSGSGSVLLVREVIRPVVEP